MSLNNTLIDTPGIDNLEREIRIERDLLFITHKYKCSTISSMLDLLSLTFNVCNKSTKKVKNSL